MVLERSNPAQGVEHECRWAHPLNGRGWDRCGPRLREVRAHGWGYGHDFGLVQGRVVLLLFPFCISLVIISGHRI